MIPFWLLIFQIEAWYLILHKSEKILHRNNMYHIQLPINDIIYVPNFCCNDALSLTMSWVGCLLIDSESFFILFEENSQTHLKIYDIPILFTFMTVSGSTESVSKQPTQLIVKLNSSLRQKLGTIDSFEKKNNKWSWYRKFLNKSFHTHRNITGQNT